MGITINEDTKMTAAQKSNKLDWSEICRAAMPMTKTEHKNTEIENNGGLIFDKNGLGLMSPYIIDPETIESKMAINALVQRSASVKEINERSPADIIAQMTAEDLSEKSEIDDVFSSSLMDMKSIPQE